MYEPMKTLPPELDSIRRGSEWCWMPLSMEHRCYIRVESVEKKHVGGWWVLTVAIRDGGGIPKGKRTWNELSRFIEAAVLLKPAS